MIGRGGSGDTRSRAALFAMLLGCASCVEESAPASGAEAGSGSATSTSASTRTETTRTTARAGAEPAEPSGPPGMGRAAFREYPIGEVEREEEHLVVVAVWLPPVEMEGHGHPGGGGGFAPHTIHLEADIHATRRNPNGFALGEWIPYLTVTYEVRRPGTNGGEVVLSGAFLPMVAQDGPHYGATLIMPGPGSWSLRYHVEPPSSGGLGRHTDPVTGVAPWWGPFDVELAWEFPGCP